MVTTRKSKLFFNKRLVFWIGIFSILILAGFSSLSDELVISISVIVIGFFLLIGYILFIPNRYKIDEKGITVYYGFGIKTAAQWNELRIIEDHRCRSFPLMREYHIGYFESKFSLWEKACIPKNRQIAALIEKYYKRTIDKY